MNNWTYFTNFSNPDFENLTATGPYYGVLQATTPGRKLRDRYLHLKSHDRPTNFWSCSSGRDVATARYFADGFFGPSWESHGVAKLHVIPESFDRGADTLTPGNTCSKYIEDKEYGHDYGYHKLARWQANFTAPIARRLTSENPSLDFSSLEIYSMMEMCGFEILVRGLSPWCDVFTKDEWLDFEFGRDLLHFYRAGPGNKYAGAMGWLWLDATQKLLSATHTGGMYFSFVHDGDIVPVLATLGIYSGDRAANHRIKEDNDAQQPFLPSHRRKRNRAWKTSDVVPMGGRVLLERLQCQGDPRDLSQSDRYLRLLINDAVVPLRASDNDSRDQDLVTMGVFRQLIREKGREVGTFADVCGRSDETGRGITFLHQ